MIIPGQTHNRIQQKVFFTMIHVIQTPAQQHINFRVHSTETVLQLFDKVNTGGLTIFKSEIMYADDVLILIQYEFITVGISNVR